MAALRFAAAAIGDLERLAAFLRESDPGAAAATATVIVDGVSILASHPLIGRPLEGLRRELVIHRGRAGYLVQYRDDALDDEVVVLAIRHQREVEPD